MTDYKFPYWGPFIFETELEENIIVELLEKGYECREKKELDARKNLAGQLDNEYFYEDFEEWFVPKFDSYVQAYTKTIEERWMINWRDLITQDNLDDKVVNNWTLNTLWINFMQAKEYNPPHIHSTSHLTFVTFLQVPEELIKEHHEKKSEHNNEGPGAICFQYGEFLPFNICRVAKVPARGMLLIFPAWLQHFVLGFSSDVERISVSGNIRLSV